MAVEELKTPDQHHKTLTSESEHELAPHHFLPIQASDVKNLKNTIGLAVEAMQSC